MLELGFYNNLAQHEKCQKVIFQNPTMHPTVECGGSENFSYMNNPHVSLSVINIDYIVQRNKLVLIQLWCYYHHKRVGNETYIQKGLEN